jgi:hypothetical protein
LSGEEQRREIEQLALLLGIGFSFLLGFFFLELLATNSVDWGFAIAIEREWPLPTKKCDD